ACASLRTVRAALTAHGSPLLSYIDDLQDGNFPAWRRSWHSTHKAIVFLCLAIMSFCHCSLPSFISESFLTWCTSKYPSACPQYSHLRAFTRSRISVRRS